MLVSWTQGRARLLQFFAVAVAVAASSPVSTLLKTLSRLLQLLSPHSSARGESSVTNNSLPVTTQSAIKPLNQYIPTGNMCARGVAMAELGVPTKGVGCALNIHSNTPDYQQLFRTAIPEPVYVHPCTHLHSRSLLRCTLHLSHRKRRYIARLAAIVTEVHGGQ